MKLVAALALLLATSAAQAEGTVPPLFCNIQEFLGSSYQEGGTGDWRSHYSKAQTRVFWEADLKNGVSVESALVEGITVKLGIGEAITWDSSGAERSIFILEGRISDAQNESSVSAESNFTRTANDQTPGLAAFLRLVRKNEDLVEISCAKRIQ